MGFKDKMGNYFAEAYTAKYGDRMTSAMGTILSFKVEESSVLGIIRKISCHIVLKPDAGKHIVKCEYKKKRWFKKPDFIELKQGHKVVVMGLKGEKGKENSELIIASNIANLTTGKDIQPFDRSMLKKARQSSTKMRSR
ncbi:MAG: hypothetical protein RR620_06495 [Clostridium sp.]